jgi:hypothetical protein
MVHGELMAPFRPGAEQITREPRIDVDAGIKPGTHVFRLIVVNDKGVESPPVEQTVTIVPP